jgi:hypothetical protein
MKPYKFEITSWFRNDKFSVSIGRDERGVIRVQPYTSLGHGEGTNVRLKPDEIDEFSQFVKDAVSAFDTLVTVNQAMLDKKDKDKKEKNETIGTG